MAMLPEGRGAAGCGSDADTPPRSAGDVAGFSLIELLTVLTVLAVVTTVYLALHRPSEIYPVENAMQRLAGDIERARDRAVAIEGEALIAVLPDGRYASRSGAPGSLTLSGTPADEWIHLPEGLTWGPGAAAVDPFGGSPAPLPAQVFCDGDGACGTPAPAAVYTIRSIREARRVAAVTLDGGGSVQVWLWQGGDGRWSSIAR